MGENQGKKISWGFESLGVGDLETSTAFGARAIAWWADMLQSLPLPRLGEGQESAEPYSVLVTTHGGFINTLVKKLVRTGTIRCGEGVVIWKCYNCSISIVEVEQDRKGTLVQYGDVSHLQKGDAVENNADEG